MSALDDFITALNNAETLMDQAAAFITAAPGVTAAAVAAQKAGDEATVTSLQTTLQAHADALLAALEPAPLPPAP